MHWGKWTMSWVYRFLDSWFWWTWHGQFQGLNLARDKSLKELPRLWADSKIFEFPTLFLHYACPSKSAGNSNILESAHNRCNSFEELSLDREEKNIFEAWIKAVSFLAQFHTWSKNLLCFCFGWYGLKPPFFFMKIQCFQKVKLESSFNAKWHRSTRGVLQCNIGIEALCKSLFFCTSAANKSDRDLSLVHWGFVRCKIEKWYCKLF